MKEKLYTFLHLDSYENRENNYKLITIIQESCTDGRYIYTRYITIRITATLHYLHI